MSDEDLADDLGLLANIKGLAEFLPLSQELAKGVIGLSMKTKEIK